MYIYIYIYIYIYTRINAPGEIPLSASGDKYYKLGWLLSFPSLSPLCQATRNTTITLTSPFPPRPRSSFSLSIHPLYIETNAFPIASFADAWLVLSLVLVHKATPRGSRTPPSQPNIYVYTYISLFVHHLSPPSSLRAALLFFTLSFFFKPFRDKSSPRTGRGKDGLSDFNGGDGLRALLAAGIATPPHGVPFLPSAPHFSSILVDHRPSIFRFLPSSFLLLSLSLSLSIYLSLRSLPLLCLFRVEAQVRLVGFDEKETIRQLESAFDGNQAGSAACRIVRVSDWWFFGEARCVVLGSEWKGHTRGGC